MRKLILAISAMIALQGVAHAQSTTQTQQPVSVPIMDLPEQPLSNCRETDHCWTGWGLAPFAQSKAAALSDAKLSKFLADAVKAGLPAEITSFIKADLKAHPDGCGPTQYLTPGKHLDLMESRNAPMYNVTVGEIDVGRGEVKAAAVARCAYAFNGSVYVIDRPAICFNWSLWHVFIPRQPIVPPTPVADTNPDCRYIFVGHVPYGAEVHSDLAARRPLPPSACSRKLQMVNAGGHGKYHACTYCLFMESIEDLKNKGYLLMEQPGTKFSVLCVSAQGCDMVMTVGSTVSERTDDDIFMFCIKYPDGSRTYVKDIHWRSYHNGWAYVVDDPSEAPADWLASGGVPHIWSAVENPPHYGYGGPSR